MFTHPDRLAMIEATEKRATEKGATENKATGNKSTGNKATGNKATGNKARENNAEEDEKKIAMHNDFIKLKAAHDTLIDKEERA